jgi:TolB-like protein
MNTLIRITAICAALSLTACANTTSAYDSAAAHRDEADFITTNYRAADQLLTLVAPKLPKGASVIMATLVNIDALESSSTLGRGVSEQLTTRFSQAGYNMIEMKFRGSVYMKRNEGELMLTREISQVAKSNNANAVVVGTYAEAGSAVFVNLRVIDPNTDTVLAATDYALPMTRDVRSLLGKRTQSY